MLSETLFLRFGTGAAYLGGLCGIYCKRQTMLGAAEQKRLEKVFRNATHGSSIHGRMLLLAVAVGIIAGLGAIAFQWLGQGVSHLALQYLAGYHPHGPAGETELFPRLYTSFSPWMLMAVITIGGLISGILVYRIAPEAEGHGTDAAIDAYHNRRGLIPLRVPLVKLISSAVTIGTGGSGGREGPIAQIGAGFGSFLAARLNLSVPERRALLAAGLGAGVGAIFRAPLAGAIFAVEVLYRNPDFETEALIPAFIATTVAYCVYGLAFGWEPLFVVGQLQFNNPVLLVPLAMLAIAMVGASYIYVKVFYGIHNIFNLMKIPKVCRPSVGAAATGLFALVVYYSLAGMGREMQADSLNVLSFGYGLIQKIFAGHMTYGVASATVILLVVGLGKIITTALTIGSGGSGGIFGPSMVIGGSLGGVVGLLFHHYMPSVVTNVDVFIILGMASFFTAAAKTPVSTLIMVTEMTASYKLLLPAMWVCALAYLMSRGWSIYCKQAKSRTDSPAHSGDFVVDVLRGVTVKDAWRQPGNPFVVVPLDMPLSEVVQLVATTMQADFPVVDSSRNLYGMFSLNDIRQYLYDSHIGSVAVAQDVATNVEPLYMHEDMSSVAGKFAHSPFEELPVAESDSPRKIIGMLRRRDVMALYNSRLLEMKTANATTV